MPHNTPSGHTGEQEPKGPRTPHTLHIAPSGHTAEQEPGGSGHRTRKTTHGADTTVNRNQVAQDTAHATRHTARANR